MKKTDLSKISSDAPESLDKTEAKARTEQNVERIGELQKRLMANRKQNLLIVLQGMDGSGKDGTVENVFAKCTASGLSVSAFKKPSDEEFAHDFLWRIHKVAPEKGQMKIFVRSHYEDILIQRVHGWIDMARVEARMAAINAWETLLAVDNQTVVLKFFLHISFEEQAEQLQQRLDDPEKHWKHNPGDWEERKLWKEYQAAYEYILNESTTPWTIVPVDQRWVRDYVISEKVVAALEAMKLNWPPLKQA